MRVRGSGFWQFRAGLDIRTVSTVKFRIRGYFENVLTSFTFAKLIAIFFLFRLGEVERYMARVVSNGDIARTIDEFGR